MTATPPDQLSRAVIHEEDGSYWAEVPECPGLFAAGDSLDELAEALAEGWAMWHGDQAGRG